jgi:triacylglycerol lipase
MPTFPFDPTGRPDTVCNAYCMASAARAAYLGQAELEPLLLEDWGFSDYQTFDSASIQGFIANGRGFTLIAFRGSDHTEIEDWVGNADFDLVFDPHIRGGQVHSGFQRGVASIWPQIQELVSEHRRPEQRLILTGHSLGGALAVLTAARFASAQRAPELDAIFTFGQPRAGDHDFVRRFDRDFKDRTFRYVNRYDLITRLPPRLLGYDHAGRLRYLDENGVLHENLSLWQQLLMTLNPKGKNAEDYINELTRKLPGAVGDHNGSRYIELLKNLCPQAAP